MVSTRNAQRVLLSVASRVFCNMAAKLLGLSIKATKSGQRRKTTHCVNCCTSPRGEKRIRIYSTGAQSMRRPRIGHYATGFLSKCRICGEEGAEHPLPCDPGEASAETTDSSRRPNKRRNSPPWKARADASIAIRDMPIVRA